MDRLVKNCKYCNSDDLFTSSAYPDMVGCNVCGDFTPIPTKAAQLYCHDDNKNILLSEAIEHAEKGHILSEVK